MDPELWKGIEVLKKHPPKTLKELAQTIADYTNRAGYAGLHKCLQRYPEGQRNAEEHFLKNTLPSIVAHALALKERVTTSLPEGVPLLQVGQRASVRLPRKVVASLVAHMFLCSWDCPRAPAYRSMSKNSFEHLLRSCAQAECAKLRMVIHFFERISEGELKGFIIIDRVWGNGLDDTSWSSSSKPLLPMFVAERGKGFEDAPGLAHADFANMYIGGGVLANGSIQEEIRFAICPELLAAMLICPRMDDDEAIQIVGAEQFSNYKGYSHSLQYDGDYRDTSYPRDADGTPLISILAMDALDLRSKDHSLKKQISRPYALRELNKAFSAFTPVNEASLANFPSIATGNWGCGAFKGDPSLKALLQWAAASQCGRQLRYFPFELTWGPVLLDMSTKISQSGATVGELMTAIWMVPERLKSFKRDVSLFEIVFHTIEIAASIPPSPGSQGAPDPP